MAYIHYNPNPSKNTVGDCVIRGIVKILGSDWTSVYWGLALQGSVLHDMPSSNRTWGTYLHNNGFNRYVIPNTCPDCYSVEDFCRDHPRGTYLLATGTHVIAVKNGNYFDTWDSGGEVPIYYWRKER